MASGEFDHDELVFGLTEGFIEFLYAVNFLYFFVVFGLFLGAGCGGGLQNDEVGTVVKRWKFCRLGFGFGDGERPNGK